MGCKSSPQNLGAKSRESVSQRCYIGSPWNHKEVLGITKYNSSSNWWNSKGMASEVL